MNTIFKKILILSSLVLCFGCAKNGIDDNNDNGAWVKFNMNKFQENVVSKSGGVQEYKISIYNNKEELIKQYGSIAEMDEKLWFFTGDYKVVAQSGKQADAVFDSPFFYGEKPFSVVRDVNTPVSVDIKLVGVKVTVEYSERIKQYFSEYQTNVSNNIKSLVFGQQQEASAGYLAIKEADSTLKWNLSLKAFGGVPYSSEGVINDIKDNTHYKIKFDLEQGIYESGGIRIISVVVDETLTSAGDTNIGIGVKRYPEITGEGFEIDEAVVLTKGDPTNQLSVTISGFPSIKNAFVSYHCPYISEDIASDAPNNFDLVTVMGSEGLINDLKEIFMDVKAIDIEHCDNAIKFDLTRLVATSNIPVISENDPPYSFKFSVEDAEGYVTTKELTFSIIDSDIKTAQLKPIDIWAKRVEMVTGRWTSSNTPNGLGFEYRKGTGIWTKVLASNVDAATKTFTATITGLDPLTIYSIRAVREVESGEPVSKGIGNIVKVQTENTPQLYNSSFEYWQKSGKVWYARENDANKFWDSGNKGAEMGGSLMPTNPEENDVKKGARAARLTSEVIMSNFAAGNIFIGEFFKVTLSGLSGIPDMEFGKPFTGRPSRFTGYYKYNSKQINKGSYNGLSGKNDRFHIYIMFTTKNGMPRRLSEANKSPFDMNKIKTTGGDGNVTVVGFGELTSEAFDGGGQDITPSVAMNDYKEFSIPINYFPQNKGLRPEYVVVVASSSKYGDFFTGGQGSCLLLDEFQLVYE